MAKNRQQSRRARSAPADTSEREIADTVRVRATQRGFYEHQIREEGEVFDFAVEDLTLNEDGSVLRKRETVQVRKPGEPKPVEETYETNVPASCTWVELVDPTIPLTPDDERELKREGRHAGEIVNRIGGDAGEPSGGEDVL